ncbi:oleosin 21.2 kDa [Carica papaya]|uniref:oleosin 21.2 kDa n=1 Tax=Carica papaya TaxID=3649 RepID=UPI000B8C9860|nr:oleosin 21.2 kDa [Carica papaya]
MTGDCRESSNTPHLNNTSRIYIHIHISPPVNYTHVLLHVIRSTSFATKDQGDRSILMADEDRQIIISYGGPSHHISRTTLVGATVAGVSVAGPLVVIVGFSLLATGILFLITLPLLVIFGPLLFGAALVIAGALAGFGAAATMAVVGLSLLSWSFREVGRRRFGYGGCPAAAVVGVEESGDLRQQKVAMDSAGNEDEINRG